MSIPLNANSILSLKITPVLISAASFNPFNPGPKSPTIPIAVFSNATPVSFALVSNLAMSTASPPTKDSAASTTIEVATPISVSSYLAPYLTDTCAGIYIVIAVSNLVVGALFIETVVSILFASLVSC